MSKIKILEIVTSLNDGGVEKLLLNYFKNMDLSQYSIDIATTSSEGMLESNFRKLGCKIIRMNKLHDGIFKYYKTYNRILKEGSYDIVHVHSGYKSFFAVFGAWCNGVKTRIAHTHYAYVPENFFQKVFRLLLTFLTIIFSTDLFSCSNEASTWTWGKKKSFIMINGIDLKEFEFSRKKRDILRKQFNLGDSIVYGCVARLSYQKNHELLIDVFRVIKNKQKKAKLILVGSGDLEERVKEQCSNLNLDEDVIFLGSRSDVRDLLNMFDYFILLSRFEGLGIVFVEAQVNGLYCFGSDKCIRDADLGRMSFIKLDDNPGHIADQIIRESEERLDCISVDVAENFEISKCVIDLDNKYKSMLLKGKKRNA